MAITDIAKDVAGISDFVSNVFGGGGGKNYPNSVSGVPSSKLTNNAQYKNKDWKSSRGYAFQVFRVSPSNVQKPEPEWKEFRLQINPQELSQDENFAIEVTPTLRGVLVEHHGVILKDIVLSGTTGSSPNRREGGALANSGIPVLQSGHSGFEEFHELRSYMRMYVEAKRLDPRKGGELRMVFKNFKDNEFLYVEPQRFSMKRTASRPFLYDYSIVLKGIGIATAEKLKTNFLQDLDNILQDVQDVFNAANKIINGSIGIMLRFKSDIQSTILGPLQSINLALKAIQGGKNLIRDSNNNFNRALGAELDALKEFTRIKTVDLRHSIEDTEVIISEGVGTNLKEYNKAAGKKSEKLKPPPGRLRTFEEFQLLNALSKIKVGTFGLTARTDLYSIGNTASQENRRVELIFNNKFSLGDASSVIESTILGDDNIQTIAARELGDVDRFREIVVLNNLRPPYISSTGGVGVLKNGDKILLPGSSAAGSAGITEVKEYNITKGMRASEKNLGVDIRLTSEGDLAVSNTKDLDLIAGVENISQAILTKLLLTRGSLKRHLDIGTNLQIGAKSTKGLNEIQSEIISSYQTDDRIESIPFIELKQESSTINANMLIKLHDIDQPVPVPITLNI